MSAYDEGAGLASEFTKVQPGQDSLEANAQTTSNGRTQETDRALVRGIAWSAGSKWMTQIVSWGSTIAVARLLTPKDYGLVGMAAVYLGLVALVSEFGIGSAIVRLRHLTEESIAQLNSVSLIVGASIFCLSCAAARPLAIFFRTDALVAVVLVLSSSFIVGAFKSVPNALLQRDFRFRTLAMIDAARALLAATMAVGLAVAGFHYWALVVSEVAGVALATVLTLLKAPYGYATPRLATIGPAIEYSRQVLVGRVAWFVYSNSDFLVAGRVLGQAALGAYDFAWTLTNIPVEKLTSLVSNVTPAVFASVQDDKQALERVVLALTEGVAMVAFPVSIGLALVSNDLIYGVFGTEWSNAIVPLRLLGIYTALRSVMPIVSPALNVRGKTRFLMYNGLVSALIFPLAFYWASGYGTGGIASVWVILYPMSCCSLLYMLFKVVTTRHAYWGALRAPTFATVAMAVAVLATGRLTSPLSSALVRLFIQASIGAVVYAATIFIAFPDRISAFRSVLRGAL